jgi:hypothetical protein
MPVCLECLRWKDGKHRKRPYFCSPGCKEASGCEARHMRKDGYITVLVHGRWISEHRWVWMKRHRRDSIPNGYQVHHRNKRPRDNRPANLVLLTKEKHEMIHADQRAEEFWIRVPCSNPNCGKMVWRRRTDWERNPHACCDRACYLEAAKYLPGRGRKKS